MFSTSFMFTGTILASWNPSEESMTFITPALKLNLQNDSICSSSYIMLVSLEENSDYLMII